MPHRRLFLIRLVGKRGCKVCQAAADKLDALRDAGTILGYDHRELDAEPHEGWRSDGSVEDFAAVAMNDGHYPVVYINDVPHSYPMAMRFLRGREGGNA